MTASPGRVCRFSACDLDHLHERRHGGTATPANLAAINTRLNRRRHRLGWRLTLDPTSGRLAATRHHRVWHSLPRGTPLEPADPPEPQHRAKHADAGDHTTGDAVPGAPANPPPQPRPPTGGCLDPIRHHHPHPGATPPADDLPF